MNADNSEDNENRRLTRLEQQLEQVTDRLAALEQAAARAPAPEPPPPASPPQPAPGLASAAGGRTLGPGAATVPQLSAFAGPGGVPGLGAFPDPGALLDPGGEQQAAFSYSGQGPFGPGGRVLVAHKRARLSDVMNADADSVARVFTALASPARITLLRALLNGPQNSQQLRRELDDPSAGQLYHHLRELLAAGLVVQPARSVYAIPHGNQVDLCLQIAVAANLTSYSNRFPPPTDEEADEDLPETPGSQQ
jgi:hypothetical protein